MTTESTATPEAPHGLKADGTPRKRAAPKWMDDPEKLKAAIAKREANRAANRAAKQNSPAPKRRGRPKGTLPRADAAPAITESQAGELLADIKQQMDERLGELLGVLKPLIDEYEQLEAARAAIE